MKKQPITSIDILKFIDGEYRTAAREVLELHGLDIPERIDKLQCIEAVHGDGLVFSYRENFSKFRRGDYVLLNPYSSDLIGDRVGEGGGYIIDNIDDEKNTIRLDEPYYVRSNHFRPEPGQPCIIDTRLKGRFPLYTYPEWASGYLNTDKDPGPIIQKIFSGNYRDETIKGSFPDSPERLLKMQKKAFRHAVRHRLSLIQGPPGTGKTFLIAQIVEAFVKMGRRVFLCSFSHRAINNALNACVRETSLEGITKNGGDYTRDDLDERVSGVNRMVVGGTAFEAFKKKAGSMNNIRKKGRFQRPLASGIRDEIYWDELDRYTRALFEDGLKDTEPEYDVVIFDEASQILIHHALMAMPSGKQYIFVGDHKQMPPVVQGYHKENPANESVFSLLMDYYPELSTMLDETRRMNQAICSFPSREYYEDRLKPIPDVRERKLELKDFPNDKVLASIMDPDAPVVFVHVDHEGYTQESPEEANIVSRIVFELVSRGKVEPKNGLCVVAAHRRQNNLIKQHIAKLVQRSRLKKDMADKLLSPDLVIDTVERIQGQERDAVIVSLTASDEEHIKMEKDFLLMPNRMNVSFTRPRSKLIVVGSKKLFRTIPADRDEYHEDEMDGKRVIRSRGIQLTNHFKRWYFHVKECHRIVEATELARDSL